MIISKPAALVGIAVLLTALVLTGCGSSTTSPPTPSPTSVAVDTPEPTPTTVPEPPTPTTTPTATATPAATPTGSPPAVDAVASPVRPSQAPRLAEEAMDFLRVLTQEMSPRASATSQERRAAEFLAGEFETIGYAVELRPFTVSSPTSTVAVLDPVTEESYEFQSFPMNLSGEGRVSGMLVDVGKALPGDVDRAFEDAPRDEVAAGVIVLIERGGTTFEEKVTGAAKAGALAATVYNDRAGPFIGALTTQGAIPAVTISRESGKAILQLMAEGTVRVTVGASFGTRQSQNVVAEKPGSNGHGVVVLGGHYDTVPGVPGANDNGSGIATLMTIARKTSRKTYPFTLQFIAFGAEELGLVGSRTYVESLSREQLEDVGVMINLDALAGDDALKVVGDPDLVSSMMASAVEQGIDLERRLAITQGSSDHAPFERSEVPFVFFMSEDFSRLHTPEDRLEYVSAQSMGSSAALVLDFLDSLARR